MRYTRSEHAVSGSATDALAFLLVGTLVACGNSSGVATTSGSNDHDSGGNGGDAGIAPASDDSGKGGGSSDASGLADGSSDRDVTANGDGAGVPTDASAVQPDGGVAPSDDGEVLGDGAGGDGSAGLQGVGSCCMEQSTPGCSNASLEVCVCEKDSTCCTTAWGPQCVLIVQQKYCQPGVRDCVCGTDAGQWGQADCCSTDWTSTCDSVATLKCGAAQGCF